MCFTVSVSKCTATLFSNNIRDREMQELSVWLNEREERERVEASEVPAIPCGDLRRWVHLSGIHEVVDVEGNRWSTSAEMPDGV